MPAGASRAGIQSVNSKSFVIAPLPEGTVDPHDQSPLVECPRCGAVTPVQGGRGVEGIELRWE